MVSVDFLVGGVVQAVSTVAVSPGQYRATLTMPDNVITVAARAADSSGNTGALSSTASVALLNDNPPAVTITAPAPGTVVLPGTTVTFSVNATDDVAVAEVRGAVSGALTGTMVQTIAPPRTPAAVSFAFSVPGNSLGGPLTFAVMATDTRGQSSSAASITLTVRDDVNPLVSIEAPGEGAVAIPGLPLTVTVAATDVGGVAQISLSISELGFSQSFDVLPVTPGATHSFTVPVPDPLNENAITLVARAVDRSGRTGSAPVRTLPVLGSFAIEATAARGLPANASAVSANTGQTIRIAGQGLTNSLVARFTSTGDDGTPGTVTATLFEVDAGGSTGSVVVPATSSTGPVRLETAQGTQIPGQAQLQIVPTVDSFSVPPGEQVAPGVVATIRGSGFREGATEAEFPGAGSTPVTDVATGNTMLTVTIPAGLTSGELFVVTDGGSSNGFPILGAFGLVGLASEGTPADPLVASANTGQTITVTGQALSTSILAVFTSTDAAGAPTTVEAALTDVNTDSTQASVAVPAAAVTGPVRLRPQGGEPFGQTTTLQVVPTLASLTVAGVLQPGAIATLAGTGFRVGRTTVEFPGAAPVTPTALTRESLTVTVPAGLTAGSVRVLTDGGSSRSLPLPGAFGLEGTAIQGLPANSAEASANVGQTLDVTGEALSTDLFMVFRSVSDDGVSQTVEAPLADVGTDGRTAAVSVPIEASTGPVRLRHRDGVPTAASVLLQVVPTLVSFQLPAGSGVAPGVLLTLTGSGFVEGATEVDFASAARVPAGDVTNNGSKITIAIPAGFASGPVKVITSGGTSNELQVQPPQEPLQVTLINPPDESSGVPVNTVVVVQLNRPVDPLSVGASAIVLSTGGVPVPGIIALSEGRTTLTFTPSNLLEVSKPYTINVSGFTDLAGNMVVPFSSSFTTAGSDTTGPIVTSVTPAQGAINVPVNTTVAVIFSEPVDPLTVNSNTMPIFVSPSGPVVAGTYGVAGAEVIFTPAALLPFNTPIEIQVSALVRDLAGNAATAFSSSFTTAAADTTPPQVTQVTPANEATGVPTTVTVQVAFSEPVDPATVTATTFRLLEDSASLPVDGTLTVAADRLSATLTPTSSLVQETRYRVEVSGIADPSGNVLVETFQSFFTTSDVVSTLIAHYPFNDGANLTADVAGGHNGTIVGATFTTIDIAPVAGNVSALAFDGAGAHVDLADPTVFSFGATSPMTISLWLKQTSPSGVFHVFGKREGCGLYNYQLTRDGQLVHFSSGSNFLLLGADFNLNTWTHVAVTYDGISTAKIYLDGVVAASSSNFVLAGENSGPFKIGDSGTCNQTFPGLIDEVRVYSGALSPAEVAALAARIQVDRDADGFPDDVEVEAGSDPLDPGSTPLTVPGSAISEAVAPTVNLLNTSDPSTGTNPDPSLADREATGATVTILNTADPSSGTNPDPSLADREATGATVSVLNIADPSSGASPDPSVFFGDAVAPTVALLNTINNPLIVASEDSVTSGRLFDLTAADGSYAIKAGMPLVEGETVRFTAGAFSAAAEIRFLANGALLATDSTVPQIFTFTVPYGVQMLSLKMEARDAKGGLLRSTDNLPVSVVPDPLTVLEGSLTNAEGAPLPSVSVTAILSGLKAEYFDFHAPLTALPELRELKPSGTRWVSAINWPNPKQVFGADPLATGLTPGYAARFTGFLNVARPGLHTFWLGAYEGARLILNGETLINKPAGNGRSRESSGDVTLEPGWYPIEIQFYQSVQDAQLILGWTQPGAEREVVPPESFIAGPTPLGATTDAAGKFEIKGVPTIVEPVWVRTGKTGASEALEPVRGGRTSAGKIRVKE